MQGVPTIVSTPEQLDSASLYRRFLALFPQRYGSVFRAVGAHSWRSMSQYHYLTDEQIFGSLVSDSKTIRAVVPDKKAPFLVLSYPIDIASPDLQPVLNAIGKLAAIGLKPLVYQQPDSADIQLFLSFSTSVVVDEVCNKLAKFLGSEFTLHNGSSPFVLPLQKGFCWLNDDLTVKLCCDDISPESAIAMFLHDMEIAISSPDLLIQTEQMAVTHILEADRLTEPAETAHSSFELETVDSPKLSAAISEPKFSEEIKSIEQSPVTFIEHSATEEIETLSLPKVGSVSFNGGEQLLLFALEATALPEPSKDKTKRGRRARSNLPDSAAHHPVVAEPDLSPDLDPCAQGAHKLPEEVPDD